VYHYGLFLLDVWVIGDSIPYWASQLYLTGNVPRLEQQVAWHCYRGAGWGDLRKEIEMAVIFNNAPKVAVIHLGGNDIKVPLKDLLDIMRAEIRYLRDAWPETILIWTDILNRGSWDLQDMRKMRRVNRFGRVEVSSTGKSDYWRPDISADEQGFFRPDGVHLNTLGLHFYLDGLTEVVKRNLLQGM